MPAFAFSGRTRVGRTIRGTRIADSVDAAVAALRREQILVTRIDPIHSRLSPSLARKARKAPTKNLAIFTRQFSVMIDAGLPLVQCLDILGKQETDKRFAAAILETRSRVEAGASLADAIRNCPKIFDPLYTNMIAAGEAGGILDVILKRLAAYIEKNVKLRSQVRSAMVYPLAVLAMALLVVAALLWKVIPTFAALFAGLGAELPAPTRAVLWLSHSFVAIVPILGLSVVGGAVGLTRFYASHRGRRVIDGLLLKLPLVGEVLRKFAVARFCRTLSTLLSSGVPILEGLTITSKTAGNAIIEDAVMTTRRSIERGESVSAPLRRTGVFPPMVTQMINVGERTGALDLMLSKIADFYEEEVETAVGGFLALVEPLMIATVGVIVGGIVISMYLPIFELINKLTR